MDYDDEAFENMPDSLPRHGGLYLHATHIGSFIDRVEVKNRNVSDRERLLNEMSDKFSRKQWLDIAEEMSVPLNYCCPIKNGI